ncbi:hypothetical protein ACFS5L_02350 [Streptomyces phyllanthi]|uniref:Uncharacterized protein n=1 Tax=Streptomyces phyllanthi TaxID=1803180 RepID=A0A5N8VTC6_9ACTN|nr:hypothetical protein [Streptomyces phyllanthi]MPY38493.1 hypothetical protein [Streptomyces phyllanthi]
MDRAIQDAFGQPLDALHAQATHDTTRPALRQALEMRSFLAVVEEQYDQVRARIHQTTAPGTAPNPEDLAFAIQWLLAIHHAHTTYTGAITSLLRTMPPHQATPVLSPRGLDKPPRSARTTEPLPALSALEAPSPRTAHIR